jgi:hypothetical protein
MKYLTIALLVILPWTTNADTVAQDTEMTAETMLCSIVREVAKTSLERRFAGDQLTNVINSWQQVFIEEGIFHDGMPKSLTKVIIASWDPDFNKIPKRHQTAVIQRWADLWEHTCWEDLSK